VQRPASAELRRQSPARFRAAKSGDFARGKRFASEIAAFCGAVT
jgi:hypothetical protein